MSADNLIGVRPLADGTYEIVHAFASPMDDDCMYEGSRLATAPTRAEALVVAHDRAKEEYGLEYGVCELDTIPTSPCGRCYVCVHDRRVVDTNIERCDGCKEPIVSGEWKVSTNTGTYHTRCQPPEEW